MTASPMDWTQVQLVRRIERDGSITVWDYYARLRWRIPAGQANWLRWL